MRKDAQRIRSKRCAKNRHSLRIVGVTMNGNMPKFMISVFCTLLLTLSISAVNAAAQASQDYNGDGKITMVDTVMELNHNLMTGDTNNDAKVNIIDLATIGLAFGSTPGDPNWNPDADVANTVDLINIFDLATVGKNFNAHNAPLPDLDPPIWVLPSQQTVNMGDSFSVDINISTPVGVYAYDIELTYDPSIISATAILEGGFLNSDGAQTYSVMNIDNSVGSVKVGITRFGVTTEVMGDGTLVTVNFDALQVGTSDLTLMKAILVNTNLQEIPLVTTYNGTVDVVGVCTSHDHYACSGDDVFWFDSCDNIEDMMQDCGDDSCGAFGADYCLGMDVYHDRTCNDRGCSVDACFDNPWTDAQLVQSCQYGCSAGACITPSCTQDSDCGTDGFIKTPVCTSDDVYDFYRTYHCNNPGTSSASCGYVDTPIMIQDCGVDSCGAWGADYCSGGDLYHDRTCTDRGCSGGSCFSSPYTDTSLVQACQYGCASGECLLSATVSLHDGMNLFSLPLLPTTQTSFNDLNSGCNVVSNGINSTCAGPGLSYMEPCTNPPCSYTCLSLDDTLYAGQGYFLKLSGPCSFTIVGFALPSGNMGYLGSSTIRQGESLIGAPSQPVSVASVKGTCQLPEDPLMFMFGSTDCAATPNYSGTSYCGSTSWYDYCYCSVDTLLPGYGYNIWSNNQCSFV